MKKIFIIGLLIYLNILVISCLPETNQEKCNKFLDEFHNPIAKKSKERETECNDALFKIMSMNILTTSEIKSGDIDSINFKERIISKSHQEKNDLRSQIKKLEKNECQKLSKKELDLIQKALNNDDSVCKNVTIEGQNPNNTKSKNPGEEGYKKFLQDNADGLQKIGALCSKFISEINTALNTY